jgi:hypothetical protein
MGQHRADRAGIAQDADMRAAIAHVIVEGMLP